MKSTGELAAAMYQKALRQTKAKSPNLEKICEILSEAKRLGSGEASYALATWYLQGNYFAKNLKKGTKLLILAARDGVPEACFDLAVSYEKGIVVEKNIAKAHELYLEAALSGDADARYSMYRLYWHGIGVKRNRKIAELWFPRKKGEKAGVKFKN
jgi:uncharacterized protein